MAAAYSSARYWRARHRVIDARPRLTVTWIDTSRRTPALKSRRFHRFEGSAIPAIESEFLRTLLIVATAAIGGAINAIAGGGTLLTFPVLVGLGIPPLVANATSAVALVPGSLSSFVGYRQVLAGARRFTLWFALPSVAGGLAGALLLLVTPPSRFEAIVPWLVFAATALFVLQRQFTARTSGASAGKGGDPALRRPPPRLLAFQLVIAIYGGYFGAGLGILMLAGLGFMGFENIHRMNGLKSWGGMCTNMVAAAAFAVSGIVDWPVAGAMAIGAIAGGFAGSRLAQRVPQLVVRRAIIAIGLASGLWLLR